MQIIPQSNGALLIHEPTPDTVYDMGNAHVYAQCDAQGRIVTAHTPEGAPLHTLRTLRCAVLNSDVVSDASTIESTAHSLAQQYKGNNSQGSGTKVKRLFTPELSQIVAFDTAQAIGRTWTLSGELFGFSVTLTMFLDRSSPAVFQRVQLTNRGQHTRIFALDAQIWLQSQRSYVGAGTLEAGQIHSQIHVESSFGATIHPWQLVVDKAETTIRYAVPVTPGQSAEFCLVTVAGDEVELDRMLATWREAYADTESYTKQLIALASNNDPLLQSLIVAGLNASLSAYKRLDSGVSGFLAGVSYAYPPRAYFRDGYWTAQAALIAQPEMVRDHLLWLAHGIGPDGSCPSGVWDPGLFSKPELNTPDVLNWITDHYDSPSFFVILLHDYIAASGDLGLLDRSVNGISVWQHAIACTDYLISRDRDGDGLFEKPHAANDWADNVMRDQLVTYDLALFYRALTCLASLAKRRNDVLVAQRSDAHAEKVKQAINTALWDERLGYYCAYQRPGFVETHLSIDTLLTVLYGIADEQQTIRSLAAAQQLLQTRNNHEQSYGDWGVMCCYPFYHEASDLFSISAEPYHYHNGADWPYWDGVYGLILLQRGDPDWRYVLTRWWEFGLAQGWLTPVEYYSPLHPRGSLLQGWSSMPAVALLSKKYATWLHPDLEST